MNVLVSLRIALRALQANKLRAGLTMLGMIIGVGAVIAMISIGAGAREAVTSQIQGMGTNLLFIRPGSLQQSGIASQAGTNPTLTYEDAIAIAEDPFLPVIAVAPEQNSTAQVIARGNNLVTRVVGTTPEFEEVRNFRAAYGEFIGVQHLESRSLVAVLGSNVADSLFGEEDPIDQPIKVSLFGGPAVTMRVIGVMESKGGTGFGNQDDQIFVPISTMQQRLLAVRTAQGAINVSVINVQVTSEEAMDEAVAQIGELLRERHRVSEDDFTIQSQQDFLNLAGEITGIMTLLLGSIAGISLVVGGVGIMNIMLVSVTERTREIGIRKAVGARRSDILVQFVVEALVVSVVGGSIGILLGAGIASSLSGIDLGGARLQAAVTADAVLLAVGVSAFIGMFFGIFPAVRAARLNPIEALRYE